MCENYLTGENFEKWSSKVILFLEDNYSNKAITKKALDVYMNLNTDSISNYEFLLGTIKGVHEYENSHEEVIIY